MIEIKQDRKNHLPPPLTEHLHQGVSDEMTLAEPLR